MSKQIKLNPIFTCFKCGATDLSETPLQIKIAPGRRWKHETCGAIICPGCGADPDEDALCGACQVRVEEHRDQMRFERHEVTSHSEPTPDWSYTDPQGHVHTYSSGTWYYVEDDPGTDEYPSRGHHECSACGARVVPGRKATAFRQYIAVGAIRG